MPSSILIKLLTELRASRVQVNTEHERRAIEAAMADLVDGILASGGMPGAASSQPTERAAFEPVAKRPMSEHSTFYGMGLKEACPKLLRLIGEKKGKIPQTPREIWDQLLAEGLDVESP